VYALFMMHRLVVECSEYVTREGLASKLKTRSRALECLEHRKQDLVRFSAFVRVFDHRLAGISTEFHPVHSRDIS
jgi:hypothetical protein